MTIKDFMAFLYVIYLYRCFLWIGYKEVISNNISILKTPIRVTFAINRVETNKMSRILGIVIWKICHFPYHCDLKSSSFSKRYNYIGMHSKLKCATITLQPNQIV